MDLKTTLDKINKDREKSEACFVFSLWKDPDLYEDYNKLNEGKDKTLKTEDAIFYYNLGKAMFKAGYRTFDHVSCETFLDSKPAIKKKYDSYGGYHEIEQLKSIVSTDNVEAFYDNIIKMNNLETIATKYEEVFNNVEKFKNASSDDVFNTFDLLNNSVSLSNNSGFKIEDLTVDDKYLEELEKGEEVGLNYGKNCPILNYTTLGLPIGDLYMFAGHSGCGKSSFIFENMILPFSEQNIKTCIISNEMRSTTYKQLLLIHILTNDLGYWKMTRKKLKTGKFTDEEKELLKKAAELTRTKYNNIKFVKLDSDNISIVFKIVKKMAHMGVSAIAWDTMKSDSEGMSEQMWLQLLKDSRKLYHLVDSLNVSMVVTYQLALHTTNQRWLDASCLSNGKQIKEVFSEMIYCRPLWEDEYTGGKYDCKPFKFNRENRKIKEDIDLDKDKKYMVCFVDKTRNDEDKICILYEWQGHFNRWIEKGYCHIRNDHN